MGQSHIWTELQHAIAMITNEQSRNKNNECWGNILQNIFLLHIFMSYHLISSSLATHLLHVLKFFQHMSNCTFSMWRSAMLYVTATHYSCHPQNELRHKEEVNTQTDTDWWHPALCSTLEKSCVDNPPMQSAVYISETSHILYHRMSLLNAAVNIASFLCFVV